MESELLNNLRSFSTILVMIAFAGICWWAFSPSRKAKFDEAANLPFSDDDQLKPNDSQRQPHNALNNTGEPDTKQTKN